MICGWAGSLACRDGISVVAGTGSIAYGERLGARARCGGWGEIFSDEGSAHWIACRGLDLFARMSDGRATRGPLYQLMRERLGLLGGSRSVPARVRRASRRSRVCCADVPAGRRAASSLGEWAAEVILEQAGAELALLVDATASSWDSRPMRVVDVSHSGGVFEGHSGTARHFAQRSQAAASYRLLRARVSPVIGAALYAARLGGQPFSDAALARVRASRQHVLGALWDEEHTDSVRGGRRRAGAARVSSRALAAASRWRGSHAARRAARRRRGGGLGSTRSRTSGASRKSTSTSISTRAIQRSRTKPLRASFRLITINVDYPDFPPLAEQRAAALAQVKSHPAQVVFAGAFSTKGWNEPGWQQSALREVDTAFEQGAVAIKVWKNIGMSLRDSQGKLVMVDDGKLDRSSTASSSAARCSSAIRASRAIAGCRWTR